MQSRKLSKHTLPLFIILLFGALGFYFWASSSNYSESDYVQLIKNDFPQTTSNDSVYSIVTYNIGYLSGMTNNLPVSKNQTLFDANLEIAYIEFENFNPDIICFQEIDYNSTRSYQVDQQEELQKIGYNFVFRAVNWDVNYLPFPGYFPSTHHGEIFSGQSILSKYPLLNPRRFLLERVADGPFYRDAFYLDRMAQVSETTIDGKTVLLINVHLEAFDAPTRTKQTEYVAELYSKYKDQLPVLLVGDFNSDLSEHDASIKMMMDIPGIGCASFDKKNLKKTFPSDDPVVRLDYIFYNKNFIEEQESAILTSFGEVSDHLPVMMKFKLL